MWNIHGPRRDSDSRRAKQAIIVRYDVLKKCGTYEDQTIISYMLPDSDCMLTNISVSSMRRTPIYSVEIITTTYVRPVRAPALSDDSGSSLPPAFFVIE